MLTLILGGARSGKSDLALRMARESGRDVLFVATMEPGDAEIRARIAKHRAQRPPAWRTLEEPLELTDALRHAAAPESFVVVDCITVWVANLLARRLPDPDAIVPPDADAATDEVAQRAREFAAWSVSYPGHVAVVSNEVGLGVVPAYPLGRVFRDALGSANRTLAQRADRAYYLVAGLAVELTSLGALPVHTFDGDRQR